MSQNAWIVAALPLASFLLIAAGARRSERASAWLTIISIGLGAGISGLVLAEVAGGARVQQSFAWLPLSGAFGLSLGFQVDPLTATMLVVVTSVSLLVQIYSLGYMRGDAGYSRYFAAMSLFTFSMLGLVLANSLLTIYLFWELVGLCSYLLIGHWHERPEAAAAAKKAFIVTRFGDFAFLLGILFLYWHAGTVDFTGLEQAAAAGRIPAAALTVGMLLVFCGAVGKSAQFPLHVWLPDAMEGPTPVSALIHAATMVAAGVYLMARTSPLLEHSATAMLVVAGVGGFTAIFAATMGLVANDIKRVLAYSTVSQLGYMMLAIGLGAMAAGVFHLFNHAFFKALLFLCAGSVIHLMNTNDMFEMGGLRRQRPLAFWATTIAALSLAGVFPLSGFWSKDEILAAASAQPLLFAAALVTVFLTATYMFRVIFLTFLGSPRGHAHEHPEPVSMAIPLAVLIVPSILTGLLGAPMVGNPLGSFLEGQAAHAEFDPTVAALSTAVALGGILFAWALYGGGKTEPAARLAAQFRPAHQLLVNRYYMDHLYDWLVRRVVLGIGWIANRIDLGLIDWMVNSVGAAAVAAGGSLRRIQSGQVQTYAWAFFAGAVTLAVVAAWPMLMGTR
ncbi:MAG: NADH-quinone oxidoreductase subunit L [Chloroflexi bacterium]|nr:NADH-quinone oxidoreductase subunit L [Chloroflexota bacterium]